MCSNLYSHKHNGTEPRHCAYISQTMHKTSNQLSHSCQIYEEKKKRAEDVTKIHSLRSTFYPPPPLLYCLVKQEWWCKAHGLYRKQVTCGAGDLQLLSTPSRFTYSSLLSRHTFLNINVLAKCSAPCFHSSPHLPWVGNAQHVGTRHEDP